MRFESSLFAVLLCLAFAISAIGQAREPIIYPDDPIELKNQLIRPSYFPEHITKKPGHYTITDWQNAIDSTWGWGLPKAQKLEIFDTFWNTVDDYFACFNDIEVNWDSLKTVYRTEIVNGDLTYGVSRGRFAGILDHLWIQLRELHTIALDLPINQYTWPDPGVPLQTVGALGDNWHFGAGLTPLPDSSLLVYKALPGHPLGLIPGDIVLGYDGIPWNDLYKQLLAAQLPIRRSSPGGSPSSFAHSMLMAAGLNWHLFDSLDVVKYGTGDTLRLSVQPLIGQTQSIWCSEQMDIPGVPMPDYNAGERATFGIIQGTQIGYIYVIAWSGNVEQEFYDAIYSLMNDYQTTGLIIDFRANFGGNMYLSNEGLSLLFNETVSTVDFAERCSPGDHLAMCPLNIPGQCQIPGNPSMYYDKPIAVLTGPGAGSAGDQVALRMKFHPMVKFFGQQTASSFNSPVSLSLGDPDWLFQYARYDAYLVDNPGHYLTHDEFPSEGYFPGIPFEEVWLTQAGVAVGIDDVVEAAETWINSFAGLQPDITYDPQTIEISLGYGQTAAQDLTLFNNGSRRLFFSLTPQTESMLWFDSDKNNKVSVYMSPLKNVSSIGEILIAPGTDKESRFPPVITGHGGPNASGYIWTDSDQPHGPSQDWVDISGIGTPVNLGDDSYAGPFAIGFDFPFFGNAYSGLYVGSNGLITFGGGSSAYNNAGIPNSGLPNNLIAMWWDDLNPAAGGHVYYYDDEINNRFIVSFVDVPLYSYGGSLNFQAVLHPDGKIDLNYETMDAGTLGTLLLARATIGIENSNGSDGLEIVYNAQYMHDNLSIKIMKDWMGITPYVGHIAADDSITATITFNSGNFPPGSYSGNIYLDSNDPVDSLIVIPVSLAITSGCDYVAGDVNGSDSYNGLDITYGVSFFKGGPAPTYQCECTPGNTWHVAGDVNGSCSYNGLDITYGVAYFKGGPGPVPCPSCPPI